MAELLVKAIDATNKDPKQDRSCWKRGMVVTVMPDGHKWTEAERSPVFVIVKLPGEDVEKVKATMTEPLQSDFLAGGTYSRCRYVVDLDAVEGEKASDADSVVLAAWADLSKNVMDLKDGTTLEGKPLEPSK